MTNRTCPVPGCIDPVPSGPHAVFCIDHFFALPYRTTHNIFALKITCSRTDNDEVKAHLQEQIAAHINIAVRSLTERTHAA